MALSGTTAREAEELRALREEVASLRSAEQALRVKLDMQRDQFSRELARKAFRISELERGATETARTFEGSLSWRVTRPLRGLKALLARRGG